MKVYATQNIDQNAPKIPRKKDSETNVTNIILVRTIVGINSSVEEGTYSENGKMIHIHEILFSTVFAVLFCSPNLMELIQKNIHIHRMKKDGRSRKRINEPTTLTKNTKK